MLKSLALAALCLPLFAFATNSKNVTSPDQISAIHRIFFGDQSNLILPPPPTLNSEAIRVFKAHLKTNPTLSIDCNHVSDLGKTFDECEISSQSKTAGVCIIDGLLSLGSQESFEVNFLNCTGVGE